MAKHPGQILREGFLAPLGIRPSRLAAGIGVERSTISRLLAETQPLTPDMAARLGRFFGVPARPRGPSAPSPGYGVDQSSVPSRSSSCARDSTVASFARSSPPTG